MTSDPITAAFRKGSDPGPARGRYVAEALSALRRLGWNDDDLLRYRTDPDVQTRAIMALRSAGWSDSMLRELNPVRLRRGEAAPQTPATRRDSLRALFASMPGVGLGFLDSLEALNAAPISYDTNPMRGALGQFVPPHTTTAIRTLRPSLQGTPQDNPTDSARVLIDPEGIAESGVSPAFVLAHELVGHGAQGSYGWPPGEVAADAAAELFLRRSGRSPDQTGWHRTVFAGPLMQLLSAFRLRKPMRRLDSTPAPQQTAR
jgi:hypothetical protein